MGQDLRELLKNDTLSSKQLELSGNHRARFLDKLEASSLATNKNEVKKHKFINPYKSKWFSIAASLLLTFSLGGYIWSYMQQQNNTIVYKINESKTGFTPSLASISPDFKKIEDYYLTSINAELAQLKITEENKISVDDFLKQLSLLDKEYTFLQKELHTQSNNINEQTLNALIENLQMRLELLKQFKFKLNNIDESKITTYKNIQV